MPLDYTVTMTGRWTSEDLHLGTSITYENTLCVPPRSPHVNIDLSTDDVQFFNLCEEIPMEPPTALTLIDRIERAIEHEGSNDCGRCNSCLFSKLRSKTYRLSGLSCTDFIEGRKLGIWKGELEKILMKEVKDGRE